MTESIHFLPTLLSQKNLHKQCSDFECLSADHHRAPHRGRFEGGRPRGGRGVTDLIKHVSQVVFGTDPGGHSVAEEDEVLEMETGRLVD